MIEDTEKRSDNAEKSNALTQMIIGAAIEVHRELGPGLLESIYEKALCRELVQQGIPFQKQVPIPVRYKGELLDGNLRLDIVAESCVIVEIKAVDSVLQIHEAQLLSYLKLSGIKIGLLINFHSLTLKQGIRRIMNGYLDA